MGITLFYVTVSVGVEVGFGEKKCGHGGRGEFAVFARFFEGVLEKRVHRRGDFVGGLWWGTW
jgi:hypothetical protein